MDADYGPKEVRLSGDELESARSAASDVISSLDAMASLITDAVEGPGEREVHIQSADVHVPSSNGAHTLVVLTADGCYAYDGHTGVCRPCNADELSSHA